MVRAQVLLVAMLVVLAGCSGVVQEDPTTTTTTSATTSVETATVPTTSTMESSMTTTSERTQSTSTTTAPDNPWEKDVVSVRIVNAVNESRNFEPIVQQALSYWESRNESVYEDRIEYNITDDYGADIQIKFVKEITNCGYTISLNTTLGCAPTIEPESNAVSTVEVRIAGGYTNNSTLETLKHEIGHVRGHDHGDEPQDVMRKSQDATTWEEQRLQNKLSQHSYPWINSTLKVHISSDNTLTHSEERQINRALSYYEEGADGWIENTPDFEIVEEEDSADIQIGVYDDEYEACSFSTSTDPHSCSDAISKASGEYRYYDSYTINVNGMDDDAVGWHIGYWLGFALGAEDKSSLPEVFQEAGGDERRSNWWV